ncbi:MAG: Uncharacterized protein AUREO_060220 [Aureobasidium pullulans]|nr:MAG: Uncharacterized protein AUREO_060220 [Aureobasidium pullulans]
MSSSTKGMMSVQRLAARRIAEGRDISDRYERVPPPKMAVAYRHEVAAQASASAASSSIRKIVGMAARRVAEGRDASNRSKRVPPPDIAITYRNESPT